MGFHREKDRLCCIYAGLLLQYVLCEKGRCRIPDLFENDWGKPYLSEGGFYFNISHAQDYVVLSFAEEENGVDIEKIEEFDIEALKSCFTEVQWRTIKESRSPVDEFYRAWTLKESFSKFAGRGLSMDFHSFTYENGGIFRQHQRYFYRHYEGLQGYIVCCSAATEKFSPRMRFISREKIWCSLEGLLSNQELD